MPETLFHGNTPPQSTTEATMKSKPMPNEIVPRIKELFQYRETSRQCRTCRHFRNDDRAAGETCHRTGLWFKTQPEAVCDQCGRPSPSSPPPLGCHEQ